MADQPTPSPDAVHAARTRHRSPALPPGVVPRHLQQWVLVGIAVVMVGILALSGPPAKPRATAAPSPAAAAVDPNQQRIEDYQRRIQEQAQRLAAEQAQLQLTKEARRRRAPTATGRPAPRRRPADAPRADGECAVRRATRATTARALRTTSRSRDRPRRAPRTPRRPTGAPAPMRRWRCRRSPPLVVPPPAALPGLPARVGPPTPPAPTPAAPSAPRCRARRADRPGRTAVHALRRHGHRDGADQSARRHVQRARELSRERARLRRGPSRDSRRRPRARRGARGEHLRPVAAGGRRFTASSCRMARTSTSTAFTASTRSAISACAIRWIGTTRRSSACRSRSGPSPASRKGRAPSASTPPALDAYRQGAAASVSQSSARVLDRFLNLLPTVTIREGHRIKVYLVE